MAAGLIGLAAVESGNAQVVSFEFTGSVAGILDPATYLPDDIMEGQAISGTVTYSSAHVTDDDPVNPNNGFYIFTGSALGELTITATIQAPGRTYAFTSVISPVSDINFIQLYRDSSRHELHYVTSDNLMNGAPLPPTANGNAMSVSLLDSSKTALPNDSIPTSAPSFSAFDIRSWILTGYTTGGNQVYGINADITSITPVPEPTTMASAAAGLLAAFGAYRRIRRAA